MACYIDKAHKIKGKHHQGQVAREMSVKRVCEMQYKISVPQEQFWDRFVCNATYLANRKLTDVSPSVHWTLMEIESVDHQTKTMKQRFVKPEFVEGYKLIAATTKVIDNEPSGLNCHITAEYEKSGLEIKDLEEVQFLVRNIEVMDFLCRVDDTIPP
ncbi:PREDICTED: uncharacterized protein LOC104705233 [Camelina sativa]|uniref:Uncharacterized protein LOC104705233 n=1 Tax=Camelina sativa TaxID=90675 RepID=A0ABM0T1H8_CAMSA|nr:PREDICTED: uncharacterized protein LOC104705233 [Camelina sativa]